MIIKISVISVKSRIVEVSRKQQVICIIATGKLKQRVWTKLCWIALTLFWFCPFVFFKTYLKLFITTHTSVFPKSVFPL